MRLLTGRSPSAALSMIPLLAGAAIFEPAVAQTLPSPDVHRNRTGPEAVAPPRIDPLSEVPVRSPDIALDPVPISPAEALSPRPIHSVRIEVEGRDRDAVPPPTWVPPADLGPDVRLLHDPGTPLDREWVESQFTRLRPMPASRAIALVQLVNRAFATAGFINSGLLVVGLSGQDNDTLDLKLVFGRLQPPDGAASPVTVEWTGGNEGLDADYVRSRFPSARRQPLNALEVERDFRLLTEDAAIQTLDVQIRSGVRPGEASLHVAVRPQERFDLYLGAANDRSPSVGGEQVFAGAQIRNLLRGGDSLSVESGLTEGVVNGQLGYWAPLDRRTSIFLRAGLNDAAIVDRPLEPLDISARERSFEVGINHHVLLAPLMPAAESGRWIPSESLTWGVRFAYRRQRSFLFGEPFSFAPGSVDGRTEYKALRLTADGLGRNVDQVIALYLTGTFGLGGTQSDVEAVANPSDHFVSVLAQLNIARILGDSGFELRGRITAQAAYGTVYSGERLSIGGAGSVRGYRETLFLADSGVIGSAELVYTFGNSTARRGRRDFDWRAVSVGIFADGAIFRNEAPPQPERSWIASTGISFSWNPSPALGLDLSYGYGLREVAIGNRDLQDRGFHFRLVFRPLLLF